VRVIFFAFTPCARLPPASQPEADSLTVVPAAKCSVHAACKVLEASPTLTRLQPLRLVNSLSANARLRNQRLAASLSQDCVQGLRVLHPQHDRPGLTGHP
jgi:hypothetical protein